jgi:hypothetical protein
MPYMMAWWGRAGCAITDEPVNALDNVIRERTIVSLCQPSISNPDLFDSGASRSCHPTSQPPWLLDPQAAARCPAHVPSEMLGVGPAL